MGLALWSVKTTPLGAYLTGTKRDKQTKQTRQTRQKRLSNFRPFPPNLRLIMTEIKVIFMDTSKNVIPAKAGIHKLMTLLDSRLRGSDKFGIIRGSLML
jgi:hypothetical protein